MARCQISAAVPRATQILRIPFDTGGVLNLPRFRPMRDGRTRTVHSLVDHCARHQTGGPGGHARLPARGGSSGRTPLGHEAITGAAERLLQDARDRIRGLSAAISPAWPDGEPPPAYSGRLNGTFPRTFAEAWNATAGDTAHS
jgi:hypothetical protein